MRRPVARCVAITVVAALAGAGVLLAPVSAVSAASAAMAPVVSNVQLSRGTVVLTATTTTSLTITADVAPGDGGAISTVHASLFADVTRPTPQWTDTVGADLTSVGGGHWSATVPVPRNASPGGWEVVLTATDASAAKGFGAAVFVALLRTAVSLTATPAHPHADEDVVLSGTVRVMRPAASPTADGTYVRVPHRRVLLTGLGLTTSRSASTDGHGVFRSTWSAALDTVWTAKFQGSVYRAGSQSAALPVMVRRNATRIVHFDVSPEPIYRNAYVKVSGTLQRHDPDSGRWVPYRAVKVTVVRGSVDHPAYSATATTRDDGAFRLVLRGSSAAHKGVWHALFAGTGHHSGVVSSGDSVATVTPPLRITRVVYDLPGPDAPITNHKLNLETVTVTNTGHHVANLLHWLLTDVSQHGLLFEHSLYVAPGHSVTIHTGHGHATSTQLYLGRSTYVWNNDGDTAVLTNDLFNLVDRCSWTSDGSGHTSC